MCIGAYIEASAWTHPYPPTRMSARIGTHLPACIRVHPPICTVKRPSVHPWIWVHGSREASHPHTTDIPTNTPGRTVICVATSGKGGGPIGEKGGTVIWARGPSYGLGCACGPMYVHVEVHPVRSLWKKRPCLHVSLGGWVEKMGARFVKKGVDWKNPRPMGENGGGPWREGKNPPGLPGHHQGKAKRYGAHMDASGRGDGILPVRHSPVALRYLKSLFRGIVEYLGAPGCTHTTTHPPVCTCGSPCLQATGYRPVPSCVSMHLSWQLETRNSQKEIPLRCARGNYDAHARQPPSRTRGFLCPYHGSSSLGFPIHFGLCHLSQWAMYLVIALPGVSGRL